MIPPDPCIGRSWQGVWALAGDLGGWRPDPPWLG